MSVPRKTRRRSSSWLRASSGTGSMRGHLSEGDALWTEALAVAAEDLVELRLRALARCRAHGAAPRRQRRVPGRRAREALELARAAVATSFEQDPRFTRWPRSPSTTTTWIWPRSCSTSRSQPSREANDDRALAIAMSTRAYIALTRGDHAAGRRALCAECLALGRALETRRADRACLAQPRSVLCSRSAKWTTRRRLTWTAFGCPPSSGPGSGSSTRRRGSQPSASRRGDMDAGLQLAASAAAMREDARMSLDRAERRIHESTLDAIRAALPEQVVTDAFETARHLSLEEARGARARVHRLTRVWHRRRPADWSALLQRAGVLRRAPPPRLATDFDITRNVYRV